MITRPLASPLAPDRALALHRAPGHALSLTTLTLALISAVAALAACSSVPATNPALEQARGRFEAAQAQPQVTTLAAAEMGRAGEALRRADLLGKNHSEWAGLIGNKSFDGTQHEFQWLFLAA